MTAVDGDRFLLLLASFLDVLLSSLGRRRHGGNTLRLVFEFDGQSLLHIEAFVTASPTAEEVPPVQRLTDSAMRLAQHGEIEWCCRDDARPATRVLFGSSSSGGCAPRDGSGRYTLLRVALRDVRGRQHLFMPCQKAARMRTIAFVGVIVAVACNDHMRRVDVLQCSGGSADVVGCYQETDRVCWIRGVSCVTLRRALVAPSLVSLFGSLTAPTTPMSGADVAPQTLLSSLCLVLLNQTTTPGSAENEHHSLWVKGRRTNASLTAPWLLAVRVSPPSQASPAAFNPTEQQSITATSSVRMQMLRRLASQWATQLQSRGGEGCLSLPRLVELCHTVGCSDAQPKAETSDTTIAAPAVTDSFKHRVVPPRLTELAPNRPYKATASPLYCLETAVHQPTPAASITAIRTLLGSATAVPQRLPRTVTPADDLPTPTREELLSARCVAQWQRRFIVAVLPPDDTSCSSSSSPHTVRLLFADQHALSERLRLERFLVAGPNAFCKPWALPTPPLRVPDDLTAAVDRYTVELSSAGFDVLRKHATAGRHYYVLTAVPSISVEGVERIVRAPPLAALRSHVEDLEESGGAAPLREAADALVDRSCRGAIMFGDELTTSQMHELLRCTAQEAARYDVCSHGRRSVMTTVLHSAASTVACLKNPYITPWS